MIYEFYQFIESNALVVAVAMFFIGMGVESHLGRLRRQAWSKKYRQSSDKGGYKSSPTVLLPVDAAPAVIAAHDAATQLRIVMSSEFSLQPLLNKSEARVFRELDRLVIGMRPDWQVMAQVSLGEILRSPHAAAYRCINSKRVDLLIVDENCQPRYAVEYQGGGHHQGTAAARDAVKKEALRRAGIGYHEIVAGHSTPSDLRRLIEKLLNPSPETARP